MMHRDCDDPYSAESDKHRSQEERSSNVRPLGMIAVDCVDGVSESEWKSLELGRQRILGDISPLALIFVSRAQGCKRDALIKYKISAHAVEVEGVQRGGTGVSNLEPSSANQGSAPAPNVKLNFNVFA
jgi:hypothetical protein